MPRAVFDRPLIVTPEEYREIVDNGCPTFELRAGAIIVRDASVVYVEATTRSAGVHAEYEVRFYLVTGTIIVLIFDEGGELDQFVRIDPREEHEWSGGSPQAQGEA